MKKSMLLILLLSPILLFPQDWNFQKKNYSNKVVQDYKDLVMEYANNYLTPIQKEILQNHYCGPECYSTTLGGKDVPWDQETSDIKVLDKISTVVHESTHHFCNSSSVGKVNSENFVVSDSRFISVPKTDVFNANFIVEDMLRRNPKVKDMFRFDTYVGGSGFDGSCTGIYDLMNEYCAYYNGTSTAFILYEVFKDKNSDLNYFNCTSEEKLSLDMERKLAASMMGSVTAFYEFNSFIGAYLIYAKENYNEVYTDIINNSLLVESYSTVTYNFSVIAEKIHEYFPEHNFKIVSEIGTMTITYGDNETLLLSQEIFNDYIDVLNEFSNSTSLLLTKK
jgi:hypothetical protein